MALLSLFIDVDRGILVESFTSQQPATVRVLTKGDAPDLNIYFLTKAASPTVANPYDYFTIPVGATLKIAAKEDNPNDFEAAEYLVFQDVFSPITNGKTCNLDLNTTELADLFETTTDQLNVWMEIEMTPSGGTPSTLIRWEQAVKNEVISDAAAPTPAGPLYYNQTEVNNLLKGGNSSMQFFKRVAVSAGQIRVTVTFSPTLSSANWHLTSCYYENLTDTDDDSLDTLISPTKTASATTFGSFKLPGAPATGNTVLVLKGIVDPT